MHTRPLRVVAACSALALLALSTAQAQFFTSDFNSADEVAKYNFYLTGGVSGTPPSSPSAAGQYQFSANLGRLAGGGLIHTPLGVTDVAAVYQASVFDLTAFDPLTISGFFRTNATPAKGGSGAVFQLGFSANNTTAVYGDAGNSFISARVNKTGTDDNAFNFQTQVKLVGATSPTTATLSAANFSLTADTWYKLSLTLTRSETTNVFDYSTILENWGSTGENLVSVAVGSFTGTFTHAELYNDSSVYAAFRSQEGKSIAALDSFSVIPEPSTFLLLAPAFAMMFGRRLRNRVA